MISDNSQPLVLGDGESGCGDIGEEVDAVRGMVARGTLHPSCPEGERSLPVPTSLPGIVSHDRHPHQLYVGRGGER